MIKSDPQGFLVGELIAGQKDILASQNRALPVWREIRSDVKSIAKAMNVQVAQVRRTSNSRTAQTSSTGRAFPSRDARGRFVSTPLPVQQTSRRGGAPAGGTGVTPSRDAGGRFVGGGGGGAPGRSQGGGRGDDGASDPKRLPASRPQKGESTSRFATKMAVGGALNTADNLDVTTNAVKEVVGPLGRGLASLYKFNKDRKEQRQEKKRDRDNARRQDRWFARILSALTKRGDVPSTNGGGHGGAYFGASGTDNGNGNGGLVGSVVGGALGRGQGLLKILGRGRGLLRRVPLLGALISGGMAVGSALGMNDDPTKSDDENRTGRYRGTGGALGMGVGGFAGAALGSLLGPVGTVGGGYIGAMLGEKVGEAIGGWTKELADSDLPGKALAAWGSFVDSAKTAWAPVSKTAAAMWDNVSSTAATAVSKTVDLAKSVGSVLVPKTLQNAASWALGKTSEVFESGSKGAGAVSTGKGDAGGASYGTYQLSSRAGTLGQFLKSTGYGAQFAGLTPGSPEFNAKWKEIAKNDPSFGSAQHDFIKSNNFDPAMAGLKASGIDLSGRGAAVQDALWSTSVQFGAGSSKRNNGAIGLINKALAGRDVNKMTDVELITAIQDYKAANNEKLFRSSSAENRAGTLMRAGNEKKSLLSLAAVGQPVMTNSTLSPVSTDAPPPVPTQIPSEPNTDQLKTPLNSQERKRSPVVVNLPDTIGQNVSDRTLAHIVTGGIGAVG